jgi:hypothetical protein
MKLILAHFARYVEHFFELDVDGIKVERSASGCSRATGVSPRVRKDEWLPSIGDSIR